MSFLRHSSTRKMRSFPRNPALLSTGFMLRTTAGFSRRCRPSRISPWTWKRWPAPLRKKPRWCSSIRLTTPPARSIQRRAWTAWGPCWRKRAGRWGKPSILFRMSPTGKSFTTMLRFPVFSIATRRALSPPPIQRISPFQARELVLWPLTPRLLFVEN